MNLDLSITVDLKEVNDLVYSDKFVKFLLSNSTDLSTPAFIIQTLEDKIKEIQKEQN